VIASGVSRSVADLVEVAFGLVGLEWRSYVEVDSSYLRPSDVPVLCGDPGKAHAELNWRQRTSFEEMIREMVEHDLHAAGLNLASYLSPAVASGVGDVREELRSAWRRSIPWPLPG
jgi:GDPmannose 4,6-dehydratase